MSWRIDQKSRARHVDELNAVSAIVELQIADPQRPEKVGLTGLGRYIGSIMDQLIYANLVVDQ